MFAKQLIFLNKGSAIIYYPRSKILSKQRHISIKRCTGQITVIEIKLTRKIMVDFSVYFRNYNYHHSLYQS